MRCAHSIPSLANILNEQRHALDDISHVYSRRAAAISEECWLLSTANDWKTPSLKIVTTDKQGHSVVQERDGHSSTSKKEQFRAPLMIRFLQWYNHWFLQCASKSGELTTDLLSVMNQESNPLLLFRPSTIYSVLAAALTSHLPFSK